MTAPTIPNASPPIFDAFGLGVARCKRRDPVALSLLHEALTIVRGERPDVKGLDSLRALFEPGFRMPAAADLLHCASILDTTARGAQPFRPSLSTPNERDAACKRTQGRSWIKAMLLCLLLICS